jgi:hypothetical protein
LNERLGREIDRYIKWLVVLGCLTLPYTHFSWMPDLGLTRPVSTVFFALAFGLLGVQALAANRLSLRAWFYWPKSWDNWPILRWWLWLLGLGIVSAAITPFYGLPQEALTRLLGYLAIFVTLFMAAYSLPRFGIKNLARWIAIGYLPVVIYAIIETAAVLRQPWAVQWVVWFRSIFIVPYPWGERLALFTTEPSFVGFQVLLLGLILPYVSEKWLRWCGWALVLDCLVFTLSGTVIALLGIYLVLWFLFSLRRRTFARLALITSGTGILALAAFWLIGPVQQAVNNLTHSFLAIDRLKNMSISIQIRFHYLLNLVYAIGDTHGLGLGIGQYGYFWKDIYLRHIDYRKFDLYGEVNRALTQLGDYMKPWSVILGIGSDLGVLGLALLAGFFIQVYRQLAEPRQRAMFFACLAGLAGAYPIVTPHLWLALAFIAGLGTAARQESAKV